MQIGPWRGPRNAGLCGGHPPPSSAAVYGLVDAYGSDDGSSTNPNAKSLKLPPAATFRNRQTEVTKHLVRLWGAERWICSVRRRPP
ncbi:hypothetical protein BV898_11387 [Hypsibius exemplaris]|uniref:Uncharacterized protein n=1 Tax=Hypsibius exemplaris TaxID=2072580 RepID=A0A1W0WGT1_HYPEX|nr:hypothetical protein BV898_11387 [Hypsibius exemplaris]